MTRTNKNTQTQEQTNKKKEGKGVGIVVVKFGPILSRGRRVAVIYNYECEAAMNNSVL